MAEKKLCSTSQTIKRLGKVGEPEERHEKEEGNRDIHKRGILKLAGIVGPVEKKKGCGKSVGGKRYSQSSNRAFGEKRGRM